MKPTIQSVPPRSSLSDLAVCYRIYPRVSGHPVFAFREKLDLVRLNLESFKEAAESLSLRLWFILDNCPAPYEDLVRGLFAEYDLDVIRLNGEGNGATFRRQIDILESQQDAGLVYFAEDDYLYVPGALERGVEFFAKHPDVEFLTLYDHADHYRKYIHQGKGPHLLEGGHTWKTVASTCLTFMARREALAETAPVFRTFAAGNSDLGLWLALTKRGVLNPWTFIRSWSDGRFVGASHVLAWLHAGGQILNGKRRTLWVPTPSLATHMETSGLAPGVDWVRMFEYRVRISA